MLQLSEGSGSNVTCMRSFDPPQRGFQSSDQLPKFATSCRRLVKIFYDEKCQNDTLCRVSHETIPLQKHAKVCQPQLTL